MTFNTGKLTAEQRKQAEADAWNQHVVDDAVRNASEFATSHSEEGGKTTASFAQLAAKQGFASGNRGCLSPAHVKTSGGRVTRVFFTPADYEALVDGRYCARCWELQVDDLSPSWVVTGRPQLCKNPKGRGCGWPRGFQWIGRLPFEISSLPKAG